MLEVKNLRVDFDGRKRTIRSVLKDVNLSINNGEIVGLLGESGAGKTVLSYSILGLLPQNAHVRAGRIEWEGVDLLDLQEATFRRVRGKQIAMIFQDPQASLNPVYNVGRQVEWVLKLHRGIVGEAAKTEVLRLFDAVKLRDPSRCVEAYPHELSGGMCQRVMIAMALAGQPKLLIADEPTSALDVSVAAEIISLLADLRRSMGLSILIITHDLSVATCLSDRIAVLDQGHLVEQVPACQFLSHAQHGASLKLIEASRFLGAKLHGEGLDGNTELNPSPPEGQLLTCERGKIP